MTNSNEVPNGFVLLQRENGKPLYAACLDGGRFHGWLMWKHPDGQWVSKRKLEPWEVMQAEDQGFYGIVHETGKAAPSEGAQAEKCKTCNGTRVVDDGEIDCYPNGVPFENGPIKCVKDCPACNGKGAPPTAAADGAHKSPEVSDNAGSVQSVSDKAAADGRAAREEAQRKRMAERFANRAPSPATADFDLPMADSQDSAAAPLASSADAIERAERILALVDEYTEALVIGSPKAQGVRTTLRSAILDAFATPAAAAPKEVELPPLPEPDFMSGDCTAGESAYTEDKVRAYLAVKGE